MPDICSFLNYRRAAIYADRILRGTKPGELPVQLRATKTTEQLNLQALHRVRERFVSQRTGITNQIRVFLS